jgi:MFS family permease
MSAAQAQPTESRDSTWRTPLVILVCGCLLSLATFGPRSTIGLFTGQFTVGQGFSIEMLSFAMAVQNLLWGLGAPFAGGLADRFGNVRVMTVGLVLYAAGLAIMAYATDPLTLNLSGGVLIGFGLSGSAFGLVHAAFGKLMPVHMRGLAFGLGSAAGSFGQFLFAPLAVMLTRTIGWQPTLLVFAVVLVAVIPATLALSTRGLSFAPGAAPAPEQNFREAIAEAFGHRSYVLLVSGFFVCGFHLAFVTIHLPKYLLEQGLDAWVGGATLAAIGLFNVAGSLGSGLLMNRMPKRVLLAAIYALRALAIALFVLFPITPVTTLAFGAAMGVLWLSTIPPTNGLILIMFGTKWAGMLYGFAFFSHQLGSFAGLVIAGWTRSFFGTYDVIWWLGIVLGIAAAVIHMPIREHAVVRSGSAAA